MKDDFETDLRRMISEAEADIGFDRDPQPASPMSQWVEAVSAPTVAAMRALWMPNWWK